MNASNRERLIRTSWDDNAELWTQAVREGRIASRIEATNQAVLAAVQESGARRILDVGCGEGWLANELAGQGFDVTGFDGSADLIAAARTGAGRFIHLDYGSFSDDPAKVGEQFDAAVCNFSLFEENLDPLMTAIGSRLVDAGRLIIQTVHPFAALGEAAYQDGWRTEAFQSLGGDFREMPWYFRTMGSWVDLLRRAGMILVRCSEPISEQTGMPYSIVFSCRSNR